MKGIALISLCLVQAGTWTALESSEVSYRPGVSLRSVDTSVYTTFYIGTLVNGDKAGRGHYPEFQILFPVSYGLTLPQLEIYNANIRLGKWATSPFDRDDIWKRVCEASLSTF